MNAHEPPRAVVLDFNGTISDDEPLLYEVYADEEAWEAHPKTEHFARWRRAAEECGLRLERTLTRLVP